MVYNSAEQRFNVLGAVQLANAQFVTEGKFTSNVGITITSGNNVANTTVQKIMYDRQANSNFVRVHYNILVGTTAANAVTDVGISLPISSNVAAGPDVIGTFLATTSNAATLVSGFAFADTGNKRANLRFTPGTSNTYTCAGSFIYEIL